MAKINYVEPYPRFSISNSKLGPSIPSVNQPAGITCASGVPCRKDCYASEHHGNYRFASVQTSLRKNLEAYLNSPTDFFNLIIAKLHMIPYKYFRWHSSGDIVNREYFEGMVRVANECPDTKFLCFTKKYDLINTYLDEGLEIPENLTVIFSHWGNYPVNNKYNLPTSHVRFKKITNECDNSDIPEDAFECKTFCGDCVATGYNCWLMGKGESVVFNKH